MIFLVEMVILLYLGMENMIVNVCHSERKTAFSRLESKNLLLILQNLLLVFGNRFFDFVRFTLFAQNDTLSLCHSERKMADSLLVAQNDNVILNVLS